MDYLHQGKAPSCVAACPMRVLDFGEFEELKRRYPSKQIYPLPDESLSQPAFAIRIHKSAEKTDHSNLEIINREEVGYDN